MPLEKRKIIELEKKLLQSPKITPQRKGSLKRYLAEAKRKGEEYYLSTLVRYARDYLGVVPPQGSIPGIKIEKKGCVNAAVGSQGSINGLVNNTTIITSKSIGSQGTIKGLRHKKINKGRAKHALPPQGKIGGIR
jgi:hypothetical protein